MTGSWLKLLVLFAPGLAFCGEPNRSWDVLMETLEPGKSVAVTRMNSATVQGKLAGIDSDSITVMWRGQPQVLRREDVYRVKLANVRRRNALVGLAVGGMVGAFGGAMSAPGPYKLSRGEAAALVGGAWAGIGTLVGGALPTGKPLYEVAGPPVRASAAR